jgi:hypothetical protein
LQGIEVTAERGLVSLSGQVSQEEEERLIEAAEAIPGVEGVRCNLHWHENPHRKGRGAMISGRSWLWMAGTLGAGLLSWYGWRRRHLLELAAVAPGRENILH